MLHDNKDKIAANESKAFANVQSNPSSKRSYYSDCFFPWQSDSAVKYQSKQTGTINGDTIPRFDHCPTYLEISISNFAVRVGTTQVGCLMLRCSFKTLFTENHGHIIPTGVSLGNKIPEPHCQAYIWPSQSHSWWQEHEKKRVEKTHIRMFECQVSNELS